MTELERLKKFLNANIVGFPIIIANPKIKAPPMPYAVIKQIPSAEDRGVLRTRTRKDETTITEIIVRRIELYLQFDMYATTNDSAYENACKLKENIYTILRDKLNLEGFGVLEQRSSNDITDRTYLEQSDFVYRYGFDVIIDTKRTVTMDTEEPQTIILKDLNYDEDLTINK